MTADDVAYSINRTVNDEGGIVSPQQDGLAGITGAEAIGEGIVAVNSNGHRSSAENRDHPASYHLHDNLFS